MLEALRVIAQRPFSQAWTEAAFNLYDALRGYDFVFDAHDRELINVMRAGLGTIPQSGSFDKAWFFMWTTKRRDEAPLVTYEAINVSMERVRQYSVFVSFDYPLVRKLLALSPAEIEALENECRNAKMPRPSNFLFCASPRKDAPVGESLNPA